MSEISAIEENPLLAAIARKLHGARNAARALADAQIPYASGLGMLGDMLLGKKPEMVEDMAYGFPPLQGAGGTTGPKPEYAADIADLIPWMGMAGKTRKIAGALAEEVGKHPWQIAGSPLAQEGAIRLGGRPDLHMVRGTGYSGLMPNDRLLKELHAPSLSITAEGQKIPFDTGVLLVPKIGAFDPAYSASTLFNRDAYVATARDYPGFWRGGEAAISPKLARDRLLSRFEVEARPGTEGWDNWLKGEEGYKTGGHSLLMRASPRFRSLKEYENSPAGARTLGRGDPEAVSAQIASEYSDIFKNPPDIRYLRRAAAEGNQQAIELLNRARTAPSEYAELKVNSPVPLTGDRWAGALLHTGGYNKPLVESLNMRGIQTLDRGEEGASGLRDMINWLQQRAGPVPEQPMRTSAGWTPEIARQRADFKIRRQEVEAPKEAMPVAGPGGEPVEVTTSGDATLFVPAEWKHESQGIGETAQKALADNPEPMTQFDDVAQFTYKGHSFTVNGEGTIEHVGGPKSFAKMAEEHKALTPSKQAEEIEDQFSFATGAILNLPLKEAPALKHAAYKAIKDLEVEYGKMLPADNADFTFNGQKYSVSSDKQIHLLK